MNIRLKDVDEKFPIKKSNIEVKSKDVRKSMYDTLAKIKLSSEYGMMIKKLANEMSEDTDIIKKAYESGSSHVYYDTDSVREE